MSKKWRPRELMYDLVSIQSDSFTEMEITIASHVYSIICEQDYWKEHPELCGLYDGHDLIGRVIPWALRRGTTDRTVVLAGHLDAVPIDNYGELRTYALDPDRLKEEMLKNEYEGEVSKDLQDDRWLFGRGVADMKGGEACALCELFEHAERGLCGEVNILFMGIHDEEHQAEGIMQSVGLLNQLKEKYHLDYRFLINPEPAQRNDPNRYIYVDGSVGKMLPGIVCKGTDAHVLNIMSGLSSTLIASNVARNIEINPDLRCEEFGQTTPPAVVLYMKDSKKEYNVSVPTYTELYAHIPLTKNKSMPAALEMLKELCEKAARETLEHYDAAYEKIYGSRKGRANHQIQVLNYLELEEICRKTDPDFEAKKAALLRESIERVNSGKALIQEAGGFAIIEKMIEISKISGPLIVIGLLPPYVPPVNNHYLKGFDREEMIEITEKLLKKQFDLGIEIVPYTMGLSDNSYISCTEVDQDIEAMRNMVTPKALYDIPFKGIAEVAMPSILCGPWGKDFHTATERVYLPDIDETTPAIIREIIRHI